MSSAACTILGTSVLAVLLAGYLAQKYLPPPIPKIVGIDLGTTYSCVGVYHAVTGEVDILADEKGHKCIPSVVAFSGGNISVGYNAEAQADHNPRYTIYDAKRFIGKSFTGEELDKESARYQFKMALDDSGMVHYKVDSDVDGSSKLTPEHIGSYVLDTLKRTAERILEVPVTRAVMSVPAEFTAEQRNYTKLAAKLAGIQVLRIINEPTAAAMAYGLHKKEGVQSVMVIDLGGGTLDVSLLNIQGGMFLTWAMAGNNHLGGQDFNQRLMTYFLKEVERQFHRPLTDPEDIQSLRLAIETAKLQLTYNDSAEISLKLNSFMGKLSPTTPVQFQYILTRTLFENLNKDLFLKVLEPIDRILEGIDLDKTEVDEIVLVGGSTRIPKVRDLIRDYFKKEPNVSIEPELAVVGGVAIQAGILGGAWPLQVSAIEVPTTVEKIHVH